MYPEELDRIEEESYRGRTVRTDIRQLEASMYRIITGRPCFVDPYKGQGPSMRLARWPERSDLPSTKGVWLGSVLENCFTQIFTNARELLQALEEYPEDGDPEIPSRIQRIWRSTCDTLANNSVPALMSFGAMAMFARWTLGIQRPTIPPWEIILYDHYF
ncbi:hypothetical protein BDV19DRAFT_393111 [Aspergillus venezuelensis]